VLTIRCTSTHGLQLRTPLASRQFIWKQTQGKASIRNQSAMVRHGRVSHVTPSHRITWQESLGRLASLSDLGRHPTAARLAGRRQPQCMHMWRLFKYSQGFHLKMDIDLPPLQVASSFIPLHPPNRKPSIAHFTLLAIVEDTCRIFAAESKNNVGVN